MRLIALDIEMNQPSHRTIQIGAVCFQDGYVVKTFSTFIHPQEPINPEITILTGIKDEDVKDAPIILEGALALTSFKTSLAANPIGIVWGAGLSNDIRHIYDEAKIESPFRSRIIDVKGIFQTLANASGGKLKQKVGLMKACELLQLGWDSMYGKPHNALADAHNTMRMYVFLSKCLKAAVDLKLS